jgi:hypothetical protein
MNRGSEEVRRKLRWLKRRDVEENKRHVGRQNLTY